MESACLSCHNARTIITLEGMTKDWWRFDVCKMRHTFGAEVSDVDTAKIIKYLEDNYSWPDPVEDRERTGTDVIERVCYQTPESVLYHAPEDVYLVSNINGSPLGVDGDGFISKIAADGTALDLTWISGEREGTVLNAPKGMAIQGSTLYVADLTVVRKFDLRTGGPTGNIPIPGSTFLNDVCEGPNGSVYVTDTGLSGNTEGFVNTRTDAVYRIEADDRYRAIATGTVLGQPNGCVAVPGGLVVVTFGSGEVYRLDDDGTRHPMPRPPRGVLDGVVALGDGRLVISSFGGQAIYILRHDQTYEALAPLVDNPADIAWDQKRGRIVVPQFMKSRVVYFNLDGATAGATPTGP
ncbi:MAG: hypothetical protein HY903_11200 [Deltaproteobacteria bacterium]|nr:hypothetical protein [Deltaproteobacteria bacterium]